MSNDTNRRTPAEQPAPASTGREPMNAAGFFAEARRLGCKGFPDALEMAARDPVAAPELDVEAERLTDTEIECLWHEACLKHLSLDDSAIPDFARAIEAKVAARFRAQGGNTKPEGAVQVACKTSETRMDTGSEALSESAQVSTEQAGDAWSELVNAANATVERWHSKDWKQPHTAEFINRLALAIGTVRGLRAPSPNNSPVGAKEQDK